MRALVTGLNGFAGSHLADYLLAQGNIELFGGVFGNCENLVQLEGRATFIEGNLTDLKFAETLLAQTQPDRIYHLAGQAFAPISWQDPWGTIEINLRSEVNVLHAAAQAESAARILVIGSFEEYGRVDPRDLPLTETAPLRPDSPYGVSKIAQDFLGLQYFLSHHLHVVRVRPSNHIGPRQNEQFVTSNFARQIAEIEAGVRAPVLYVGNLTAQRDFTDVHDMMRAYYLALERGAPGEVYNIGSGRAWSIQQVLGLMLQQSRVAIRVEEDPARLRPSDTPATYCDASKFRAQTGWEPKIPLEQSLRDILDYWRGKIQSKQEDK
ncbi:MAG: GDP-mannose 4,6-dehydratase [Chloroflexota bacterium]|nr:GDP-mannose 4,6-dehydratase [Chloroflexota bacterium]